MLPIASLKVAALLPGLVLPLSPSLPQQQEAGQTPHEVRGRLFRYALQVAPQQRIEALQKFGQARALYTQAQPFRGQGQSFDVFTMLQQPILGMQVQPAPDILRAQLDLPEGVGLVVTDLADGSLAAQAGIQKYDLLLAVGDAPLKSAEELQKAIDAADGEIALKVRRKSEERVFGIAHPNKKFTVSPATQYFIGVQVEGLDDATREQLDLGDGKGLFVKEVVDDSPAEKAGVQANDILVSVGEAVVADSASLIEAVQKSEGKPISLQLVRKGDKVELSVEPAKREVESSFTFHAVPDRQFQFFGPGVVVDPSAQPGGPQVTNVHPFIVPGQQNGNWVVWGPDGAAGAIGTKLDELAKQIADLRKEIESLKQDRKN